MTVVPKQPDTYPDPDDCVDCGNDPTPAPAPEAPPVNESPEETPAEEPVENDEQPKPPFWR